MERLDDGISEKIAMGVWDAEATDCSDDPEHCIVFGDNAVVDFMLHVVIEHYVQCVSEPCFQVFAKIFLVWKEANEWCAGGYATLCNHVANQHTSLFLRNIYNERADFDAG